MKKTKNSLFVSTFLTAWVVMVAAKDAKKLRGSTNHAATLQDIISDYGNNHTKRLLNKEEKDMFEGDIIPDYNGIMTTYGKDEVDKLRQQGMDLPENIIINRRWGVRVDDVVQVPYVLANDFGSTQRSIILPAIEELGERTGVVKFVPRTSETDYIRIIDDTGCYSWVGRQGGPQDLSLRIGSFFTGTCITKGVTQHEFLHALGFWHEQNRPDRDEYVTINFENIQEGREINFDKQTNSETLGGPYDYGSVMHYGAFDFSSNNQKTIVAPEPIGQRDGADDLDILEVRLLYQCVSGPRTVTEYNDNRCTTDCKCWEGEQGCDGNGNDDACQGDLICSNNRCVAEDEGPNPTPLPTPPPTPPPAPGPSPPPTPPPTETPTNSPSSRPTVETITSFPTAAVSNSPTEAPVFDPTDLPTPSPTTAVSNSPTEAPVLDPTETPTSSPTESPEPAPTPTTGTCVDDPIGWYDSWGPFYTCEWYGVADYLCQVYGDSFANDGKTANEACCSCGGGTIVGGTAAPAGDPSSPPTISLVEPTDTPVVAPTLAPVPSPTDIPTGEPSSTPTIGLIVPTDTPVVAQSGAPTEEGIPTGDPTSACVDVAGWYDSEGPVFDCAFYSRKNNCGLYGNDYENSDGLTANQACCECGGGTFL